jgi:diaminopropionate ammonia-lyase
MIEGGPLSYRGSYPGARLLGNPHLERRAYGEVEREIVSLARHADAVREIRGWPGYAHTPLHRLPTLAGDLGLGAIWYKDEGPRFGVGSFKALGGPYGVSRLLRREIAARVGDTGAGPDPQVEPFGLEEIGLEGLRARYADLLAGITMTCASTGNHGRALAWAASLLGCRSVIFVPRLLSPDRAEAIASRGGEVVHVDGGYDEALRESRETARAEGWFVISDKSEGRGTEQIGRDMMQGCTVLIAEVLEQLPSGTVPTHVFVQAGVGGLAAATTAHLWEALGDRRPTMVIVESEKADCLLQSVRAGRPVTLEGSLDTMLGGLKCREPSPLAWEILRPGAHFFSAISDEASISAMRRLGAGGGDAPIDVGESGAASAAALLSLAADPAHREALGLSDGAAVVVVGTEGATDARIFEEIVGRPPRR